MTKKQEQHIKDLTFDFTQRLAKKYRRGAKEHGGDIFDYGEISLIDNSIDELIDAYVYLRTLRTKLRNRGLKF